MSGFFGVLYGLYHRKDIAQDKSNRRHVDHQVQKQDVEVKFSPRPVNTKYVKMPIVQDDRASQVAFIQTNNNAITPASSKGQWSTFQSNIDTETQLRNQDTVLQRCDLNVYVPNSASSLYNTNVPYVGDKQITQHSLLFKENNTNTSQKPLWDSLDTFNNSTRYQRNE